MTAYRDARVGVDDTRALLGRELEELENEIRVLDRTIDAKGGSLLDRVQIASPCPARWDDMKGDATKRACSQCQKDVYNLSAMTTREAEAFLEERVGLDTCVQFYQRADGGVMTTDCRPPRPLRRVFLIASGVSLSVAAILTTINNTANNASDPAAQKVVGGGMRSGLGTTTASQSPYSTGK